MIPKPQSLAKRLVSNTTFGLLDQILFKVGNTVAFILLVRFLPSSSITAVGIAMGYLVLTAYLDVGLHRILLRDYPKIKFHETVRQEHLSAYLAFWALQAVGMLLLWKGVSFFALDPMGSPELSFLFFGMTMDFIALVFQDLVKGVFYADFKQGLATKIGFILTVSRLLSYGLLFLLPSLTAYTWILIASSGLSCIVWGTALAKSFRFRPIFTPDTPHIVLNALCSYSIWDHLNRTVIDTLMTIDILILTLCGHLQELGSYAIASKVTSLLFLMSLQLSRSLQLALSNCAEDKERVAVINTFLKANAIVSVAQLLFIAAAGTWLLSLLFGADVDADVIRFTTILAAGATVINLGWPLVGVINNLCSLRRAFIDVFLPVLMIGVVVYVTTANSGGAAGIAYGKIVVFSILIAGLVMFVRRHYPFGLRLQLVTFEERNVCREVIGGLLWSPRKYSNPPE